MENRKEWRLHIESEINIWMPLGSSGRKTIGKVNIHGT